MRAALCSCFLNILLTRAAACWTPFPGHCCAPPRLPPAGARSRRAHRPPRPVTPAVLVCFCRALFEARQAKKAKSENDYYKTSKTYLQEI